jgi:hypothetical protein
MIMPRYATTAEDKIIGEYCLSRITARLPKAEARMLAKYRTRTGASTSAALRNAIRRLAAETGPDAELADLCKLLGLPADADSSAILDAVNALLGQGDDAAATEDGGDGSTSEVADQPKKLSRDELAFCKREGITEDEFRARVAGAAKRSSEGAADTPQPRKLSKEEQAYCKREGISGAEFRARMAGAAKRSA